MRIVKTRRSVLGLLFLASSLVLFDSAFAKIETVLGSVALKDNVNLAGMLPSISTSEIIISRDQYIISYNRARRAPNWVAWKVEASQLGSTGRSNDFMQDSELENYLASNPGKGPLAVDPKEYQGSCFDRGHQVPSGDRTDNVTNNQATFLMSNMIPQTAYLNRDIWEHLERHTRDLVHQGKKVYVIAGPVYDEDFGAIGPKNDIPVPSKDFKIIIVLDANQSPKDINKNTPIISVLMPNVLSDGSKPTDHEALCGEAVPAPNVNVSSTVDANSSKSDDWQPYEASVSDIEKASGISIDPMKMFSN